MSGFEIFFLDGGATASALVGAGAAAIRGRWEARRDDQELAAASELPCFQNRLIESRSSAATSHRALTAAWRSPLSLYSESLACERGVPEWALEVMRKALQLIDESSELGDLADVYDAQLQLAQKEQRHFLRQPVWQLCEQLETVSERMSLMVRHVWKAREAYDDPANALQESPSSAPGQPAGGDVPSGAPEDSAAPPGQAASSSQELAPVQSEPLPLAILRDRKVLGQIWRAAETRGDRVVEQLDPKVLGAIWQAAEEHGSSYKESLARVMERRGETAPPELSPYVLAYT